MDDIVQRICDADPSAQVVAGEVLVRQDGAMVSLGRSRKGFFMPTNLGHARIAELAPLAEPAKLKPKAKPKPKAKVVGDNDTGGKDLTLGLSDGVQADEDAGL